MDRCGTWMIGRNLKVKENAMIKLKHREVEK
jgi:hypothetical protein